MGKHNKAQYPDDWPQIAKRIKDEADWTCIRCGHPHDPPTGYVLTVHHLDGDSLNNQNWWNLTALCQRCHLHIQNKVTMEQPFMFEHSKWFLPYVAGYYAHILGLDESRDYVEKHADEIIRQYMNSDDPLQKKE